MKSNRSAIGARVQVVLADRSIYRVVNSGSSFGDTPLELHIGLGNAKHIQRVQIHWPSGLEQSLTTLEMDKVYQLREGDKQAQLLPVKAFAYAHGAMAHHH